MRRGFGRHPAIGGAFDKLTDWGLAPSTSSRTGRSDSLRIEPEPDRVESAEKHVAAAVVVVGGIQ